MAVTVETARELLLERTRSNSTSFFNDAWAITLLSVCERTVNAGIRSVLETKTLNTTAYQTLYFLRSSFTAALYDAIDIVGMTIAGEYEVRRASVQDLFAYDPSWFRTSAAGAEYRWYVQLGRDLLLLYPARTAAGQIKITYSVQPPALEDDTDEFALPDEDVPMAVDLATIVLAMALRIPEVVQDTLANLQAKLGVEAESRT